MAVSPLIPEKSQGDRRDQRLALVDRLCISNLVFKRLIEELGASTVTFFSACRPGGHSARRGANAGARRKELKSAGVNRKPFCWRL